MEIQEAIRAVTERQDLNDQEMTAVMRAIMTGEATPAQIAGFLVGLRMKGETVAEIAAAARVMRELAVRVGVPDELLVDTCGTGGDASGTFNISTASAFAAAAAGCRVAKHGNRSVSSCSGSADVLEALGVALDIPAQAVARSIDEVGVGFLFAPRHHGAMKHAVGPRKEMGLRTLFNVLGPLTNPADAPNQVLGVYDGAWLEPLAEVARELGSRHVLVVHAEDGLDEISISGPTNVAELNDGEIHTYTVAPEDFGLKPAPLSAIRVPDVAGSVRLLRSALGGEPGPARDIVALNAGAAIYAAGRAESLNEGVRVASETLDSGTALERIEQLSEYTQPLREGA